MGLFSAQPPITAIPARVNPRKVLPASPRNIDAGLKLNFKNPRQLPAKAIVKKPKYCCPVIRATTKNDKEPIAVKPVANPSMPSKKLTAFVMPTTQITVRSTSPALPHQVLGKKLNFTPHKIKVLEATTCPNNFHFAPKCFISSINPINNIIVPPMTTPFNSLEKLKLKTIVPT